MDTNLKLFNKYDSEITELTENVANTTIESKLDMESATGLLKRVQSIIAEIKTIKETLKRPHIDINNAIEKKFKETLAPFDDIKKQLTSKQVSYQQEIERQRLELERKEREAFEAKQKALEEAKVVDQDVKEMIEEKHEEKKQVIDIAYSQAKQKWFYYDYEIVSVDIFNVDRKYLNIKDLKAWIEIRQILFNKIGKVK